MGKRVIASAIDSNELMQAFHDLVAERWDNWELTPFLTYLVDTCEASALPYLAEQFDCDGVRGFAVADSEEQQRELIKRSIALHKFMGTPWAVKEACNAVGFPVYALEEGVTVPGALPSATDWAQFRVVIEIPDTRSVNETQFRRLKLFIEIYKNARSHLVGIDFLQRLEDGPVFRTETGYANEQIYDGSYGHNGEIIYGAREHEKLEIQLIMRAIEVFVDINDRYIVDSLGRTLSFITTHSVITGKGAPVDGTIESFTVQSYK